MVLILGITADLLGARDLPCVRRAWCAGWCMFRAVTGLRRRFDRRRRGVALALILCVAALTACSSSSAAPPASLGTTLDRPVPASLRQLPLTNQRGETVSLESFAGKTLLVVPFLTLCTDVCPLTTGNLVQVQHSLTKDGARSSVEIVEVSVDPGRDTPARLAAYARLTGASWQLVTESPTTLATMAKFFGWYYQQVPEDNPPSIDWWTGKPLTYDVDHSDGFVVIDPGGRMRFETIAAPAYHGPLNPRLERFLSALGRRHLLHPSSFSYTAADMLDVLGWSMHQSLPAAQ